MKCRTLHIILIALMGWTLTACEREPLLHLYDAQSVTLDLPIVDLDLRVYWDYDIYYGTTYNWQAEWYYGWDDDDRNLFGELGYVEPTVFCLRRYYTGSDSLAPHTSALSSTVEGTHFQGRYDWGFWDILVWNNITTLDGVQSLIFDENSSLDSVTAYTGPSMNASRYQAPRYTHSFYEPEPLFAAYEQNINIDRDLKGFVYDAERNVYVRTLNMTLYPITYIYLTQVILRHNTNNEGRIIKEVEGIANLSGLARSTTLNTGVAGEDAITVYYYTRLKKDCNKNGELVDIAGGRLMTFGLCGNAANSITDSTQVRDPERHYMDLNMRFYNDMDSTFVFDVTDQVRRRWKGGVITVELDMDTVPIPKRKGGSGFNAVVKDLEEVDVPVIEM